MIEIRGVKYSEHWFSLSSNGKALTNAASVGSDNYNFDNFTSRKYGMHISVAEDFYNPVIFRRERISIPGRAGDVFEPFSEPENMEKKIFCDIIRESKSELLKAVGLVKANIDAIRFERKNKLSETIVLYTTLLPKYCFECDVTDFDVKLTSSKSARITITFSCLPYFFVQGYTTDDSEKHRYINEHSNAAVSGRYDYGVTYGLATLPNQSEATCLYFEETYALFNSTVIPIFAMPYLEIKGSGSGAVSYTNTDGVVCTWSFNNLSSQPIVYDALTRRWSRPAEVSFSCSLNETQKKAYKNEATYPHTRDFVDGYLQFEYNGGMRETYLQKSGGVSSISFAPRWYRTEAM